jgi:hypothetical protein
MKKLNNTYLLLFAACTILSGISCTGQQRGGSSPKGYDLINPVKYAMPESLREISGIAFNGGKSDILYAEQDEEGRVYYFRLGDKQVSYSKFDKKGDYEDVAILGQQMIVLKSNGELFVFPFSQVGNPNIANVQKQNDLFPAGEYEGLYADEKNNQLYVLCKHCGNEKASKQGGGYILKLSANGVLVPAGQFTFDVKEIETLLNKKKVQFHPSALAKNQRTNEWFILSSVNKLLVIADDSWKVKAVYPINSSLFLQPEGIAFDKQYNLYISNEGDKITPGTVLKFNYKKQE